MTSTSLTTTGEQSPTLRYSEDQVRLIRQTVAPQLDDAQFATFMLLASRTGLDPLSRQIYAIPRKKRVKNDAGQWEETIEMTLQTGIDGLRAIGQRTRECTGVSAPEWCDRKGLWRDVWLEDEPPAASRVTVYRNGEAYPFVATYREYVQKVDIYEGEGRDRRKVGNKPNAMWENMPANQLAKCAEAGAWRKAFPVEMGGVFVDEEEAGIDYVIRVEGERTNSQRTPPRIPQQPQRLQQPAPAAKGKGKARPAAMIQRDQPEREPFGHDDDDQPVIEGEVVEAVPAAGGEVPFGQFWNALLAKKIAMADVYTALNIEPNMNALKDWYASGGSVIELVEFVADAVAGLQGE